MSYGQGADQQGEMDWPGQDSPAAPRGGFQRAPRQQGRRSFKPKDKGDGPGDDYIEVKARILEFYAKYPDGRIQTEVLVDLTDLRIEHEPVAKWRGEGEDRKQVTLLKPSARGVITVQARVYRTADDARPCIGHSYLMMPGQTPYTEGSELENAETSAVGRALAMSGIAVQKGIASGNEVRSKGGSVEEELDADEAYAAWQASQAKAEPVAAAVESAAPTPQAAPPEPAVPLESKHVPPAEPVQPPVTPPEPPAPAPVMADPGSGEVLEGADAVAASTADATGGMTATDLAGHMKAAGIGSVVVIGVAKELFGHSNIRSLSDSERAKLWEACAARHSAPAATQ